MKRAPYGAVDGPKNCCQIKVEQKCLTINFIYPKSQT